MIGCTHDEYFSLHVSAGDDDLVRGAAFRMSKEAAFGRLCFDRPFNGVRHRLETNNMCLNKRAIPI
jgi:hypothetical protein